MHLRVELNKLLPVWFFIWLTAAIVSIDLIFFEIEHDDVIVTSLELRPGYKSGKVCELGLQFQEQYIQKSTDSKTCQLLTIGNSVKLKQTRLLGRWLALYSENNVKITGDILENRILTDVLFIIMAMLMPVLLNMNLRGRLKTTATIAFGFQIFGVLYFWSIFLK